MSLRQRVETLARAVTAVCVLAGAPRAGWAEGGPADAGAETPALPSFEDALEYADNAWVFGDYDVVVGVLAPRLLPEPPPMETRVLVRAYSRLASSAYFIGDLERAEAAIVQILRVEPTWRLDPLVYPAQVLAFFEEVRDAHPELARAVEPETAPGEAIFVERSVREQSRLVSMVPFGYGFFASGQDAWGMVYLLGQASMAVTSVSFWATNEASRTPDGLLLASEANLRRQRIHVGTGWAFLGLVVINAVHGAIAHQSEVEVGYRRLADPPPEFAPQSAPNGGPRSDAELGPLRGRAPGGWMVAFTPIFGP